MQLSISFKSQFLLPLKRQNWAELEENLSAAREAIRKGDTVVLTGDQGPIERISNERDLDYFFACL
jgi:hypothetical protein